jgi:capsular polysaccharide biosynthesis protein
MPYLDTLMIAWRKRWLLLIVLLVPIIAAVIFAATRPTTYTASIAFTINRINKQPTTEYQFDGYYALQASDLFSDTVVSWFLTPSSIVDMYDRAGINPNVTSLSSLTSRFNIKKFSAQNLNVKFTTQSQTEADKLASAVIQTVQEKTTSLNQSADRKALFEAVGSKPVIVANSKGIIISGIVGLIIGFFLDVLLIGLLRVFGIAKNRNPLSGTEAGGHAAQH